MGQATIFAGQKIKTLKSTLNLNGGADIISSTTNPQSSAVSAEPGSLLLNTSSGTLYRKLDSGSTTNWAEVGAGTGGKNYIVNPDFDGGQTTGWSMKKVSLSSLIPTGNILTADAGHTIAVSSSSPLEGANSLLVQGASLFTAGNCLISDAFAIDREDQAKVMGWSFSYEAVTTNMDFLGTSAGTWAVYIAEVTTATPDTVVSWIQPAGVYNLTQGSGVGLASGTFQTTASGTAYRLVLVCINSEAAATTLKVDDFQLGPQKVVYGSPVTDWQNYTPVWSSNGGTQPVLFNGTILGRYRRVGDSIEAQVYLSMGSTTTFGNGTSFRFSYPTQHPLDLTKVTTSSFQSIGGGAGYDASTNLTYVFDAQVGSGTTTSFVLIADASNNVAFNFPFTWANGDLITASVVYPAAGLSSSVQMSNDTDTRVVAAKVAKSGVQVIGGAGIVKLTGFTAVSDTSSLWDLTNNRFNISVSGIYQISLSMNINVAQVVAPAYRVNGVATSYYMGGDASGNRFVGYSTHKLNAGDFVEFYPYINGATNIQAGEDNTYATLTRVSGPSVIAANETVAASYGHTGGQSIPGTTWSFVDFTSKNYDSHSGWVNGTGYNSVTGAWGFSPRYVVPVSGKYSIKLQFLYGVDNYTQPTPFEAAIYRNNGEVKTSSIRNPQNLTATRPPSVNLTADISCNAGDLIQFATRQQESGNRSLNASANTTFFEIVRVGN